MQTVKLSIEVTPEIAAQIIHLMSGQGQNIPKMTAQTQPPVTTQITTPLNVPMAVPTSAQTYTMDELSLASRPIVEAGRQAELLDFLHSFNIQSIVELPIEKYPAFAQGIRQLGGKI